ncbi:MAG: TonB-dependent receptor plug domain-containing protein [Candidatus Rokuibacteriota bacterium]
MTRVIWVLMLIVSMVSAAPGAAQEPAAPSAVAEAKPEQVETLDPVVVSATRTPTPIGQTGSSVTVIDQQEIESRQVSDMLQILRDVPGLSVIQTGSRGGTTSIFTRGGNSDMNQVLIDGMKVNLGGGFFDFANLTTVGIGRAEIVRGPQSALYGPDAMTSVMQFFTPRGDGPFGDWGFAGGGNYGTNEERVGLSWGNRLAGAFFEFGHIYTAGILPVNNSYENYTAALRLDFDPTPDLGFTLTGRYVNSAFHFPTEGAGDQFQAVLDPNQSQKNERFVGTLGVRYRQTSWLEHRFKIGGTTETSTFDDPSNVPPDFPGPDRLSKTTQDRILIDYNAVLSAPKTWGITPTFVLGASYEHEGFLQDNSPPSVPNPIDEGRHTWSGYGELQASWLDRVFLTAGGRYDDSTAFGQAFSPRVTFAVVAPVTQTRLRGAYGQGIKAPSFFAQFGGFGIPGNPDLKPEESESWEVGIDQPLFGGRFQAGVTYFHNNFKDLIAFVSTSVGSQNIQTARTEGVEVVFALAPIRGWRANANYTYLDTLVTDDGGVGGQNTFPQGQPLLRRPRNSGSISVGYQWDRLLTETTLYVKGASIDRDFSQPGAPRVNLPGYQKLDLAVAYTLFRDVVGLRNVVWKTVFQNILNEQYQEVFGFSSPRFSVLTGIEVRY